MTSHKALQVDINCDMGESYGRFTIGNDRHILPYVTSCNIACGFHAGDPSTILETIRMAIEEKKKIGAHPSYPDLMGFGRRNMWVTEKDLYALIVYQISAIKSMTESEGGKLHHVKPHGALYHALSQQRSMAETFCRAVSHIDPKLILYTLPGSILHKVSENYGLKTKRETFADRRYLNDGTLAPRTDSSSLIVEPAEAVSQTLDMVINQKVKTVSGNTITMQVDTICIHGDTPGAVDIAKEVWKALSEAGVSLK